MASVDKIIGALQGHISDTLLETVRSELTAAQTQAKSAKRQRIYEYLDGESEGEIIAEEYFKSKQEASKQTWRITTENRLVELCKELKRINKHHKFEVVCEERSQVIAEMDRLVQEWNASMGSRCENCDTILKIHVDGCWWFRQHTPQSPGKCTEAWYCDVTK